MVGENSSSKAVTRVIGISTWWDYLGFPQYNKLVANHTLRPTSQICKCFGPRDCDLSDHIVVDADKSFPVLFSAEGMLDCL